MKQKELIRIILEKFVTCLCGRVVVKIHLPYRMKHFCLPPQVKNITKPD